MVAVSGFGDRKGPTKSRSPNDLTHFILSQTLSRTASTVTRLATTSELRMPQTASCLQCIGSLLTVLLLRVHRSGSSVVKLGKAGKQKSLRAMKSNKYLDADEDDVKPKSKQLGKSKSSRKLTKGKSSGNLKSAGSRPGSAKGSRPGSAKKGAGAAGSRRTLSLK